MVLFLVPFAFAGNDYYISFNDGTTDVNNVGYETFLCDGNNGECNTVSSNLNSGTTSGNTYHFNALGTDNYVNYAAYFYKDGFVPAKALLTDKGTGQTASANYEFNKVENCIAPIIDFSVVNEAEPNKPLTINVDAKLDATTASAFRLYDRVPNYQPDSWRTTYADLFSATTFVEIKVSVDGNYVETLTQNPKDIFADETAEFTFIYIPTTQGVYDFEFKAYVDDNQCAISTPAYASDTTTVVNPADVDYSYVIIKDLEYSPSFPVVGQTINFTVDYLSNYVSNSGIYNSIPTKMTITLREGYNTTNGPKVSQKEETFYGSTVDTFDTAYFKESVNAPGWYTLVVEATPVGNGDILNRTTYVTFYVGENEQYDYKLRIYDADSFELVGVRGELNTGLVEYSNIDGEMIFTDLYAGTYDYTLTLNGYYDLSGKFTLTNSDNMGVVYMQKIPINPPNVSFSATFNIVDENNTPLDFVTGKLSTGDIKYSNNGLIEFTDLDSGMYSYNLTLNGYNDATGTFNIYSSDVEINVTMTVETPGPGPGPGPNPEPEKSKSTSTLIDIDFDAIDHVDLNEVDYVMINFKNSGSEDIDNVKVTISIPELSVWDTVGPLDLDDGDRVYRQVYVGVDYEYEPGWYYMRIQVDGDNYNRARWYEVYLE